MRERGSLRRTARLTRRFLPYFKPYRRTMAFDLTFASLTTACELALPAIVGYFTDAATRGVPPLTLQTVLWLSGLYVLLRVIDTAANYYMASMGHYMGAEMETDMRRDLFGHLQQLSFAYYDNAKVGQLMSRLTNDLNEISEFAHHCPEEFFIASIKIVVAFVILSGQNIYFTLIIFSVLPFMVLFSSRFNRRMRDAFRDGRHQMGELNAQSEDSLLGIRVVKSFANEPIEREKFERGNRLFYGIKRRSYGALAGFQSTIRLFDGLMYIVVVTAGALFMIHGQLTPGAYVGSLLYISALLNSIRRIVEFAEQFQRGMTGIERFAELMDESPTIRDEPGAVELTEAIGSVTFENVSFTYAEGARNVLTGINLEVEAGESVALVGPSGSGKTTLCNLIPRFYDVTGGRVLVDGRDIRGATTRSLRSLIGVVQQDVYMFSGTVRDNIEYGKPGASMGEIEEAARMAGAHEFIAELKDGYDTYVGERGVKLSGGQKQRVSIARVFLKNPPILILDEATSSLDNESERIVQRSLERLAEGRTTFTIAHRLTTIRGAGVILVLTEDGIVEQGSHDELMARRGVYYGLYRMHSRDGEERAEGAAFGTPRTADG